MKSIAKKAGVAVGRAWRWVKKNKLLVIAGVLTAGETMVQFGIELPGSEFIPLRYRGVAIAALMSSAFILRIIAARKER